GLKVMDTATPKQWVYLAPNPKSHWRQLFVKGTSYLARDLYALYVDPEGPRTPEQVAEAYGVPVEAVREAIAYCDSDPPEMRQDIAESDAWFEAQGLNGSAQPPASKQR
ncbi:MAG TPA: hypothetical protein VGG61_07030, partial [Gemmataceae bacterium]